MGLRGGAVAGGRGLSAAGGQGWAVGRLDLAGAEAAPGAKGGA